MIIILKRLLTILLLINLLVSCGIFRNKKGYFKSEYIETTLKLNDSITLNAIFDTGASFFSIDSLFSKRNLIIKNYFSHNIFGVGVSSKKAIIVTDTLKVEIENNNYNSAFNTIINLKSITGGKADAVLGTNLFQDNLVLISSKKNSLEIIKDSSKYNFSEYKKIPYEYINGKIIINAEIHIDSKLGFKGRFLVDTGYPGQLSLNSNSTNKLKIENKANPKAYYYSNMYGIGGKSEGFIFIAKSIKLSDYELNGIITDCTKDISGAFSLNKDFDGLIGYGLLKKFDIIFDFKNRTLFLKAGNEFEKILEYPNMGFSFIDRTDINKGFVINSIIKDSNAENAGIKLDDNIIKINNVNVTILNKNQYCKIIRCKKIKLTIKRKAELINIYINKKKII